MALRSLIRFLKVLSIEKILNKKIFISHLCFTQKFHTLISRDYFIEIIFLIINKANKAPSISATI
jgi:hypothetical protein